MGVALGDLQASVYSCMAQRTDAGKSPQTSTLCEGPRGTHTWLPQHPVSFSGNVKVTPIPTGEAPARVGYHPAGPVPSLATVCAFPL